MNRHRQTTGKKPASANQLRIIGGEWRGRKLTFTAAPGLRPTGDRIRETLFNWLAPEVHGARCLDLFAGSGALGLEALSRGAAHCDFVDNGTSQARQIEQHLSALGAGNRGLVHCTYAENFLSAAASLYDIVFIDPPFDLGLASPICELIANSALLQPDAAIYLETAEDDLIPLPDSWQLHREKKAGSVRYRLLHNTGP